MLGPYGSTKPKIAGLTYTKSCSAFYKRTEQLKVIGAVHRSDTAGHPGSTTEYRPFSFCRLAWNAEWNIYRRYWIFDSLMFLSMGKGYTLCTTKTPDDRGGSLLSGTPSGQVSLINSMLKPVQATSDGIRVARQSGSIVAWTYEANLTH